MKILFATSECAPFSKSGGLADVAFSLPPALQKAGHECAIITPLYQCVKAKYWDTLTQVKLLGVRLGETVHHCGLYRGELDGVTVWFVENDGLFDRPKLYGYDDDKFRFAYFSRAIIELIPLLDFMPEILHCNDWETAPAIIYLKNDQAWRTDLQGIKTVYTIHNIAYQGQFGAEELEKTFALPSGWYQGGLGYEFEGRHDINLMKGAMLMSDAVSTVSPTYARELHSPTFGMGLQGVADTVEYKLYGILNGINMDHYDPSKDPRIVANFDVDNMEGKAACKQRIQEFFDMDIDERSPMLCSVARLNEQKGIELIREILPRVMEMGVQLVVFGQGEQRYIDYFNWAKATWPGQIGFSSNYSEDMAAQIFAGADMYLMPSRFEPCGLSQMMAMRYGTVPIVHETGGLKDSIRPYRDFDGIGDGFSFQEYTGKALYLAILEAVRLYFGDMKTWKILRKRDMEKDFSWAKSADQYARMYGDISDGGSGEEISFQEAFENLKAKYVEHIDKLRESGALEFDPDYHLAIEFTITGRGAGVCYCEFTPDGLNMQPYTYEQADARVSCSYDNLMSMITGKVKGSKLFMNGQLKISGNMTRGTELRMLLGK